MNFFRFLFILLLFASIFSQSLFSQRILSLEECLDIAILQGPDAKIAATRFEIADLEYKSFRAGLLPGIVLNANLPGFNRAIKAIVQPDGTQVFVMQNQAYSTASLMVNTLIPWTGSRIFMSSGLQRLDIFGTTDYSSFQANPLMVGISQPIFKFNNSKWEMRSRPLVLSIKEIQYLETLEDIRAQVTGKFFDVYIAKLQLDISHFNLAVNDSVFRISQGRYNMGVIAENDLLQSELGALSSLGAVRQAEISLDQAIRTLNISLGFSGEESFEVIPPDHIPNFDPNQEIALEQAVKNRSDFKQMRLDELNTNRAVASAKASRLPGVEVNASYGLNQSGASFSEAYNSPLSQQAATVGLNIPLFTWGKGKVDVQTALLYQSATLSGNLLQTQKTMQNIEFRVRNFYQYRMNAALAAKSDTIAQRRYDVSKERYIAGKSEIQNLQNAQMDKDNARSNFAQALKQYWTSYYELRRETLYDFVRGERIGVR